MIACNVLSFYLPGSGSRIQNESNHCGSGSTSLTFPVKRISNKFFPYVLLKTLFFLTVWAGGHWRCARTRADRPAASIFPLPGNDEEGWPVLRQLGLTCGVTTWGTFHCEVASVISYRNRISTYCIPIYIYLWTTVVYSHM